MFTFLKNNFVIASVRSVREFINYLNDWLISFLLVRDEKFVLR